MSTQSTKTMEINDHYSNSLTKSWIIWGCAALFYGYQFMLRVSPGVMANDLRIAFNVDACALGLLTGCYYYTYSFLQIPVGSLMDHFKPRRMLTLGALLCSIGTLVFSSADNLYVAAFGRALIGVGSGFGFLSCLKLGTIWFPVQKLPLVVGLTVLLGTIGGVSAGGPMGWLVEVFGWRHALWIVAFVGFGLAFLSWVVVKDKAPKKLENEILRAHKTDQKEQQGSGILKSVIEVIKKPQCWFIALYGITMYVPLAGFTDLWGPSFFKEVYNFDNNTAGAVNSALYIGLGLGAPLFPFLCKKLGAYKPTVFISAFGSLIFLMAIIYLPVMPTWLLITFLVLAGFFLAGQFLAFPMTCALNPLSASATAGGFQNMICMLSGVIFQPIIGFLLDLTWKGGYENGIRYYTTSEYNFALSVIIISLVISCLVIMAIEEKYVK